MQLTPQQLEAAARQLCVLRGLDANYVMTAYDPKYATPGNPGGQYHLVRWAQLIPEIEQAFQVMQVIASVAPV